MTFVRITPTALNQWDAFINGQLQAAACITRNETGSVTLATKRTLTTDEASALAVDTQELEAGRLRL